MDKKNNAESQSFLLSKSKSYQKALKELSIYLKDHHKKEYKMSF